MYLYFLHHEGNLVTKHVNSINKNDKFSLEKNDTKTGLVEFVLSKNHDLDRIPEIYNENKKYLVDFERERKNNNREKMGLDVAISLLKSNMNKKEIFNYNEIIKSIKDPRIKCLFLKFIKEHNETYYNELENDLSKLMQDSKVSIQQLLNNYGISKNEYNYNMISHLTFEELETILKAISILNISNQEKVMILYTTSIEQIMIFKDYLSKSLIPISFISSNPEVLKASSPLLSNLKENLETLRSCNIPLSLFENANKILLSNSQVFKNNIYILADYSLLKSLETTNEYSFLNNPNLASIIDKYLELGYEKFLDSDLSILNKKEIKRLEFYKIIGVEIETIDELNEALDENKEFFTAIDSVDEYNDESIQIKEKLSLDSLEQFRVSERLYNINGIIISAVKVKRLVEQGYSVNEAITFDLRLDEEEISNLNDALANSKTIKFNI